MVGWHAEFGHAGRRSSAQIMQRPIGYGVQSTLFSPLSKQAVGSQLRLGIAADRLCAASGREHTGPSESGKRLQGRQGKAAERDAV